MLGWKHLIFKSDHYHQFFSPFLLSEYIQVQKKKTNKQMKPVQNIKQAHQQLLASPVLFPALFKFVQQS